MPGAGCTLLIDSGPSGKHLHAVLLGPLEIEGYGSVPHLVLVGITTRRAGAHFDPACVLNSGDHRFVVHESFAAYRYARAEPIDHVDLMLASAIWRQHDSCSPKLLARLIAGARTSSYLRADLQSLFT